MVRRDAGATRWPLTVAEVAKNQERRRKRLRHHVGSTVYGVGGAGIQPVVLMIAGVLGWHAPAWFAGQVMAQVDLATGHLRVMIVGLPLSLEYYRFLQKKYGVEARFFGCTASPFEQEYAEGYNAVSTPGINRRFGHDIFREALGAGMPRKTAASPARRSGDQHRSGR
jgi:hypothetical protein